MSSKVFYSPDWDQLKSLYQDNIRKKLLENLDNINREVFQHITKGEVEFEIRSDINENEADFVKAYLSHNTSDWLSVTAHKHHSGSGNYISFKFSSAIKSGSIDCTLPSLKGTQPSL